MMKITFSLLFCLVISAPACSADLYKSGVNVPEDYSNGSPERGSDMEQITPQSVQKKGGSFNVGLGLSFADVPENMAVGWDAIAGYEWIETDIWNIGAQFHYLEDSFSKDTSYHSLGLYVTARPVNRWFQWMQFKAGVVSDGYSSISPTVNSQGYIVNQNVSWSGTGGSLGVGFVLPEPNFQFHLLDIERHFVAGHSFNVYTISVLVLMQH